MPGTISFTPGPGPGPINRPSAVTATFRWTGPGSMPELLVNIRCISAQQREGEDTWAARFRYTSDGPSGYPTRFEQTYPINASGPGVVSTDDRVFVLSQLDDGSTQLMFDGFIQSPQADLGGDSEMVTLVAFGTPIREYDTPLAGQLRRDANTPDTVSDIQVDDPIRFNPNGHPNASPEGADAGTEPAQFPTFLGPKWPQNTINGETIRIWTLGMAARYIICQGNKSKTYVNYTDLTYLDVLLQAVVAVGGDAGPIDMTNPATFTYEDIECQDVDISGEPWPLALSRILEPHGFAMRWILQADGDGLPTWTFRVYRKDDNTSVKSMSLQVAGNAFDPYQTNIGGLSLVRDTHDLANAIYMDATPVLVECSFILAPLFEIAAGDVASLDAYVGTQYNEEATNGIKYRRFGFDECGEGHWDFPTASMLNNQPGDFKAILTLGAKSRANAIRYRPGLNRLVSQDDEGKPIPAILHVSTNWTGGAPAIYDGKTGDWQKVWSSEWKMLDDRLGIQITAHDPNSFALGIPPSGIDNPASPGGTLNIVEQLATPDKTKGRPLIYFMLTCSVYADQDFNISSLKRPTSPTKFTIARRVDRRDQLKKEIVSKLSYFYEDLEETGEDDVIIDDSDFAQDITDAYRRSREMGKLAGSASIKAITTAYSIGDKISRITGRNVSLQSNSSGGGGESPIFPSLVAISYEFEPMQSTSLELEDRRAEPAPQRGRRTKE